MNLVIHVAFTFVIFLLTVVQSETDVEHVHDDLKSAEARQKIYDIISSHEDRKYGDHGGHEYEEGEIPRRRSSRKNKRYGYLPNEGKYYYLDPPQKLEKPYQPKSTYDENDYTVHSSEAEYAPHEKYHPVVETAYAKPKRGYLTRANAHVIAKKRRPAYILPKASRDVDYHDSYVEDKTAPITIGKTARTVYASPVTNTHYAGVDPKTPSEYITLDGQKPKPLILDPKLKATYHLSQPEAHYSTAHQHVVKSEETHPAYKTIYQPQPEGHYSSQEHHAVKAEVHQPVYKTAYAPQPAADYHAPEYQDVESVPTYKTGFIASKPVAHYSAPEQHHAVVKPDLIEPVHYPVAEKKYVKYDDHKAEDRGHHASGYGYFKDNSVKGDSGHKSHGHHETSGHKAHSSVAGRHDEHDRHHNRGLYERDRGYHYEKAYAYDRIRALHDIGSDKKAHSSYGAHHGQEAHKDAGQHGSEHYNYFKKDDHNSGHGYQNGNSLYKKGHNNYQDQKYVPVYY